MHRQLLCCLATFCFASLLSADDWTQWRGPTGNNHAAAGNSIPTEWSETKNVLWKAPVPGRGHSSPVVIGDRIILTTADEANQDQVVLGFDRKTGKQLWATSISKGGFPKVHTKNTHASATVCTDGKTVCAVFHHHNKVEAAGLTLDGKIVWKKDVGAFRPKAYEYGYAASPTLYNGTVIISGDADTGSWLKAYGIADGKLRWEVKRPNGLNWSSPIIATVAGREQMFLSGSHMMASYDPSNGKLLWDTPCLTMACCGTCVFDEDTVYASGGYPKRETVAVKADGSDEILWRNGVKCYEQSMLLHNGYLYALDDGGVMYCWNAKTGEEQWKQRFRGPVSASPILVGDTIYAMNEKGETFVFKANPNEFEPVAKNNLGTESFSTPTVVDNVMYLRVASGFGRNRKETMYAIANGS